MRIISEIIPSMKKAFALLRKNDPLILSSSTAFFTTFSISPILIILIDLLNPILGMETIQRELFSKIQRALGHTTARDVKTIVDGFEAFKSNLWFTILSTLFFLFIATTLLGVIKQAMHQIWSFRVKGPNSWAYFFRERLTGIAMMMLFAVLMLFTYWINWLENSLPPDTWFSTISDLVFTLFIVSAWFTILFKFLPEAKVSWFITITGGLFTGTFFNGGVFILSKILVHKNVALVFGVSSSMAMLLLFIFYCSFILYLGVAFMFEYSIAIKKPIRPGKNAIEFQEKIKSTGK